MIVVVDVITLFVCVTFLLIQRTNELLSPPRYVIITENRYLTVHPKQYVSRANASV